VYDVVQPTAPSCRHCLSRRHLLGRAAAAVGLMVATGALAVPAGAADEVQWGYEGEAGPESWGRLSPEFAVCSRGRAQSPVDIPTSAPVNPPDLAISYRPTALNIFNNGHTIQVDTDPGSVLRLDGLDYALVQYHFHARSEHTFNGNPADMELHLVHRNPAGGLAVVGVLMTKGGADSPAFAPTLGNLPAQPGPPRPVPGASVNPADMLPTDRAYYRYDGSLTTPPCSEGVKWLVMTNPVRTSDGQVAAFQKLFARDYRPVQPLNGRSFQVTSRLAPTQLPRLAPTQLPRTGGLGVEQIVAGLGLLAGGLYLRRRPGRA
jgi:carbonic anhydrase